MSDVEEFTPDEIEASTSRRTDKEMNALHADVAVEKLVLDVVGKGIPGVDVSRSLITGDVTRTIEGASQLSLTVHDFGRDIIQSGILVDSEGELRAVDVRLDGLWFRLIKFAKQGDDLILTLEDRDVAWLRAKKGPRKAASRAKVTRAEYILQLVRSVKKRRIPVDIHELHKKQDIKNIGKKQKKEVRDRRRSKGFDDGVILEGKEGTLNKSQLDNASRAITVADELNAPDRAAMALVEACIVEGPDFKNPQGGDGTSVGILQLTQGHLGGSVKKRRDVELVTKLFLTEGFTGRGGAIELARKHPDWNAGRIAQECQGSGFGSRYAQYRGQARRILKAWGSTAGSAAVFKRYEYRVEKKETYWDAIQRLAKQVGWRAFMSAGRFHYISEKDLMESRARYRFSENTSGIINIDFEQDYRKKASKATVTCRIDRWGAPPGTVVVMEDMGSASGKWLIMDITRSLFSTEATITLKKPMKERPEPRPEVLGQGSGAVGGEDTALNNTDGGAKAIVDNAVTIAQTAGGAGVYVGSDYRPGSTVGSGAPSDHSQNNSRMAARDIGVRGIDLLVGPPSPKLDKAILALGHAFGRDYSSAKHGPFQNADTFSWRGFRIQIIWRTPQWGGHMGHIHIGARYEGRGSPETIWRSDHKGKQ